MARKPSGAQVSAKPRNFVAKHSAQINKPKVHRNKKKDYQRTPKHRHRDLGGFLLGEILT